MNAAASPQVEIASLKAWKYRNSNDSVTPEPGCYLIDAELGGNKVLVEYEYDAGEAGGPDEPATAPQVTLQCFWVAGNAFDLDGITPKQKYKWEELAYDHAEKAHANAVQDALEERAIRMAEDAY